MPKLRTHYDTLKVSRDAPMEVIQAAYRSLARKYHPDRVGSSPEAEAAMKAINAAYEVLSDPAERAKHDQWIAAQSPRTQRTYSDSDDSSESRGSRSASGHSPTSGSRRIPTTGILLAVCYIAAVVLLLRLPGPPRLIGVMMLIGAWAVFVFGRRRDSGR